MSNEMSHVTCLSCQYTTRLRGVLERCPKCGSRSGIRNSICVASLEIFPSVQFKVERPSYQGKRKYARETKSSAEHSVDGQLVRVDQSVDRENDRYRKNAELATEGHTIEVVCAGDTPPAEKTSLVPTVNGHAIAYVANFSPH